MFASGLSNRSRGETSVVGDVRFRLEGELPPVWLRCTRAIAKSMTVPVGRAMGGRVTMIIFRDYFRTAVWAKFKNRAEIRRRDSLLIFVG
jgi:hypothetical protein